MYEIGQHVTAASLIITPLATYANKGDDLQILYVAPHRALPFFVENLASGFKFSVSENEIETGVSND